MRDALLSIGQGAEALFATTYLTDELAVQHESATASGAAQMSGDDDVSESLSAWRCRCRVALTV